MVNLIDGLKEGDHESVDRAIDTKILAAEKRIIQNIKLWFFTGLLGLVLSGGTGFGIVIFQLGRMSEQYSRTAEAVNESTIALENRARWMERKDILDDDMIRYLRMTGYTPPSWYLGRDADITGK